MTADSGLGFDQNAQQHWKQCESLNSKHENTTGPEANNQSRASHGNTKNMDDITAAFTHVQKLFERSAEAKIWSVARKGLDLLDPPIFYPEYTKPNGGDYVYRKHDFWTSGFFPGSLYLLLQRRRIFDSSRIANGDGQAPSNLQLEYACRYWTESLHQNASLQDTHDVGFMIMPWAKLEYELNGTRKALETIETAAHSLFSRFNAKLGCIRSWDKCVTKKYDFCNPDVEYMVIIDNMMNLDLLFYVAAKTQDSEMHSAAATHARKTAQTHVRADGSTTHLVVLDPKSGDILHRLTNQGYAHTSCWTRGQAWAIAGFAETYGWTHATEFLDTARRCADYFLRRAGEAGFVPWDFDAPRPDGFVQPPDTSAAVIAAYGMLLIHRHLVDLGQTSVYLAAALNIMDQVCFLHLGPEASYATATEIIETVEHGTTKVGSLHVDSGGSDTILNGATINNYEFAPRRWADHGLVYADYYFLRVGNLLLEMGLAPPHICH